MEAGLNSQSKKLAAVFLISGISAIIYQIVWQRRLFTLLGTNIESITLIVSLFMAGLGFGALLGGFLSKKFPSRMIPLFIGFELAIGLFGVMSLWLIQTTGLCFFLLVPTLFMGATLPVLVTNRDSVSLLYFVNTLGAALGCFLTVDVLFVHFGLRTTTLIAASLNFFAAAYIWRTFR